MHSITPQADDYFCASQLNKPFCLTIGWVVNFIYDCVGQSIGIFLLGCVSSANLKSIGLGSITTIGTTTFSITILSITALSIITLSIKTFSITINKM
jgi:hypothetical protein